MTKLKIKTGDTVKVIAGDHKGSEGKIIKVLLEKNKVIVEGVNMVKKQGTGPATGFQAEQGLAWPHCPILKNVRDSIFCLYNGSKEACLEKSV